MGDDWGENEGVADASERGEDNSGLGLGHSEFAHDGPHVVRGTPIEALLAEMDRGEGVALEREELDQGPACGELLGHSRVHGEGRAQQRLRQRFVPLRKPRAKLNADP